MIRMRGHTLLQHPDFPEDVGVVVALVGELLLLLLAAVAGGVDVIPGFTGFMGFSMERGGGVLSEAAADGGELLMIELLLNCPIRLEKSPDDRLPAEPTVDLVSVDGRAVTVAAAGDDVREERETGPLASVVDSIDDCLSVMEAGCELLPSFPCFFAS